MRNLGKVTGPYFKVVVLPSGLCETEVKGLGNTSFSVVQLNNNIVLLVLFRTWEVVLIVC